ncbi:rhomboid family intramembrane serine protease [Pararhodobacter oceanensis]|uniref:rhomboid family intramembrane serine protease n=1 Tax=Pararhodobacter oceanensis TaxID=2172121 RepID=UPI003A91B112
MTSEPNAPVQRHAPVLIFIVGICAILEALFTLIDPMLPESISLRGTAMIYGAFWPELLRDWNPLFPGQRVTMFVSYAFLHGGFMHMLFNMLILLHLGRETVIRLGPRGFLLMYLLTAIGGGAAYGLLASGETPMLGASGAVFGLFGATMYWDFQRRRAFRAPLQPVLRMLLGLVVMNVLLYFLVGGMLAWQAHLGGYLAGVLVARIATPTLAHDHRRKAPPR